MTLYVRKSVNSVAGAMLNEDWHDEFVKAEKRDLLLELGYVTCQTCDGSGLVEIGSAGPKDYYEGCPHCGGEPKVRGLGVVPSDEMIRRGVESRLWEHDDLEAATHAVKGILLTALGLQEVDE